MMAHDQVPESMAGAVVATTAALQGSILVHIPTKDGVTELRLAMALAEASKGRVIGVVAEGFDAAAFAGGDFIAGPIMQAILTEQRGRMAKAVANARGLIERAQIPVEIYEELRFPEEALADHAAGADWILAVRPEPPVSHILYADPGELALRSGLPILVPPDGAAPLQARRIVVGWRDTREARRAVTDAMPLLSAAEEVLAVCVSSDSHLEANRRSLEQLVARLNHHGCKARLEVVPERDNPPVADVLQDRASAIGADLIVMGAYAHSRLGEWIFGGVTRALLGGCKTYVLMSH
jgi:nucleotide-binding universal stress UspA family protein